MKRFLALLVSAGVFVPAAADTTALQRCRGLGDSTARLACYDAIPLSATPAAATSAPPAAAPATPTPAAAFGLEYRAQPAQTVLPAIETAIDGLFDGWLPRGQLKLANGQVWEIADGSTAAYNLKSPKVKITRGVSGTFFIAIDGVSQTPRVRRIK